jgi:glycosyltransferase involved in cell wall biosynthesis/SAM-dependent methyltransferase
MSSTFLEPGVTSRGTTAGAATFAPDVQSPSGTRVVGSMHSGVHVVQVSYDDSVLDTVAGSEPRRRQAIYGEILERERPGSEMTVLVVTSKRTGGPLTIGNVRVLPVSRAPGQLGYLASLATVHRAMAAVHRRRPIDVLAVQSPDEIACVVRVFGRSRSIPVVGQLHYDFFNPAARRDVFGGGWIGTARSALALRLLRSCAALRVVGARTAAEARKAGLQRRIEVLPVAVEMAARPARDDRQPRARRVLFVGRLCSAKNIERWLAVAARVAREDSGVTFDIVGDGPSRPHLEEHAGALGLRHAVRFLGFVPYENLGPIYAGAAVFLLTSDYEGFGRVLVEAYSHGTPVVATRLSGVEDIVIDGKTGLLHDAADVEGMARSVGGLLSDPAVAARMGQDGAAHVCQMFNPRTLAARWVGLLLETARRSASDAQVLMPRPRTLRRWRAIASSPHSLLRALQYEAIDGLRLSGRTLDVGGGQVNSYYSLLDIHGTIESVNIDPKVRPTHLLDLNRRLPFSDGSYDNLLSLNTFEHIANDVQAVAEAIRVLRPGGEFHIIVPFLYRVHGSPSDYHRHTAQWWHEQIVGNGTPATRVVIEPLVWDRMMSGFSLWDVSRLARRAGMLVSVLRDLPWRGEERLPGSPRHRAAVDAPVGYYIRGCK